MTSRTKKNDPSLLQVLICTLGREGLERVARMALPRVEGVEYLVACQSVEMPLPESLRRNDVEVHFNPGRGLSQNRNFAFAHTTAPLALIADDDLIFTSQGLKDVIDTFEHHPQVDIATFKCKFPFHKQYPTEETDLRQRVKNYYFTSYEIAVRMQAVRKCGLTFNENMGIGAERFHSGEEAIFIDHALRSHLTCRFFPITIVEHPDIPTGRQKRPSAGVLQADGVLIAKDYSWTITPRLILKALRCGGNFLHNLRHLTLGAAYYLRHPGSFKPWGYEKSIYREIE